MILDVLYFCAATRDVRAWSLRRCIGVCTCSRGCRRRRSGPWFSLEIVQPQAKYWDPFAALRMTLQLRVTQAQNYRLAGILLRYPIHSFAALFIASLRCSVSLSYSWL